MERENDQMIDHEFNVLDQLYFVISFSDLQAACKLSPELLRGVIWKLLEKGWVKCFDDPENEIEISAENFTKNYLKMQFLATKKGLMAHNTR